MPEKASFQDSVAPWESSDAWKRRGVPPCSLRGSRLLASRICSLVREWANADVAKRSGFSRICASVNDASRSAKGVLTAPIGKEKPPWCETGIRAS